MEGGGFKIDLFLFVYVVTFNVFWKLLNWIVDKKKRGNPQKIIIIKKLRFTLTVTNTWERINSEYFKNAKT